MKIVAVYEEYSKELLEKEALENYQKEISRINKVCETWDLLQSIDFPCALKVSIYSGSVEFYPPKEGWPDEKVYRDSLTLLRRIFNITKFDKKFNEYNGTYYWQYYGSGNELTITVYDAIPALDCKVVKKTKMVEVYESVCEGQKESE